MKKRIAIVYPWGNLDTVPSLCNAAELLANTGYEVEIFTYLNPRFIGPSFSHKSIMIVTPRPRWERQGIHRLIPARWSYPLQIWQRHLRCRYRCFIGVDPEGLVQAGWLSRWITVPLVYYSLELLLSGEIALAEQSQLKRAEKRLSHRAAFIIIQDEERARLMAEDNDVPLDRFVLVPNTPQGPARRQYSGYWHKKLGLPERCRIVLHAGSIENWTGLKEIVDSVKEWPEDWVLVIHSRSYYQHSGFMEELRRQAPEGRVFFSLKPVSRQDYDALIHGADIGIAFYVPSEGSVYTQQNIRSVGLSSGKIAYYLRAGLPVIANDQTSIGTFINQEKCGLVIQSPDEIGEAIVTIVHDYDSYSKRSLQAFDRHLDFTHGFHRVTRWIDSLEER
ncbi:MAG: glycosyltransferase [bacterium]